MELTLEQLLRQGVAAHNLDNLEEAERLYRKILQSDPKHADANHNLGIIAVSMNQSGIALPLFKRAVGANPNIELYWQSYIGALITEHQFDNAKQALKKARRKNVAKEKLKILTQKLLSVKAGVIPMPAPPQAELQNLINHYRNGRYPDAEDLALSMSQQFPKHQFSWKMLGVLFGQTGRNAEALMANQKAVELSPQDAEAHSNLGNVLREMGRLEEAEASYRQAIASRDNYSEAYSNLGNTLHDLGRLEEAEASYKQAIALKSDYAEAHSNLGNTLQELGRFAEAEASCRQAIVNNPNHAEAHSNLGNTLQGLDRLNEAETSFRQAISLKPDYAKAHSNLAVTLQKLSRLKEAEASYRKSIALNPNYAEAHNNLGITLQELGRLGEAEASYKQAIKLKADHADAHSNLGIILYGDGDTDSALSSMERANFIDPKSRVYSLFLSVLQARKFDEIAKVISGGKIRNSEFNDEPPFKTLILNRSVKEELIFYLQKLKSVKLETQKGDPSFGNTRGGVGHTLFEVDHPEVKSLAKGLKSILMKAFNSDIFIDDSFFSIFGAGGGTVRHNHLNSRDKGPILSLANQKYALVYYLAVGDQECSEPGILKLYAPDEDITPREGLIAIFPADRYHSSVYGGNKDRVIVGVNFYSL